MRSTSTLRRSVNDQPPTVLHVIDSDEPGGAETVFVNLADRLREHGVASLAVAPNDSWAAEALLGRGITYVPTPTDGSFNITFLNRLVALSRHHNVHAIQTHLIGASVYGVLAGLITRRPVISTFHGSVDVEASDRLWRIKSRVLRSSCCHLVAVSDHLRGVMRSEWGLYASDIRVIRNGIDLCQVHGARRTLRPRLGLSGANQIVGCLGNLHPAKGYQHLLAAARIVVTAYPEVHFAIAGHRTEPTLSQLESLVRDFGLTKHVHFLGFVDNPGDYLSELDMFVLPSISEGLSIATMEAMNLGLPCVLTRCGGPQELAKDRVSALFVDPGSPSQLADSIIRLLQDDMLRKMIGTNASHYAHSNFSMESMISKYLELYGLAG